MHTRAGLPACALILSLFLGGCTAARSWVGREEPDAGVFHIGAARADIEAAFGKPALTRSLHGRELYIYKYRSGYAASSSRAGGILLVDIMYLGLPELVGPFIEGHSVSRLVQVEYNDQSEAVEIRHFNPPGSVRSKSEVPTDRPPPPPPEP